MNNPNKLTGETVLEKLKYWHDEAERSEVSIGVSEMADASDYFGKVRISKHIVEDLKWCIEQIKAHGIRE